jgi:nitrate reductase gamma subunit
LWWNANPVRLYVLEGVAGIAGFAAFLSGASLVLRFLRRPTRSLLTELFDTLLLAALFTSIVSGVLVAIIHRWGSSWGVTILTPYIMSLLRGGPAPDLVLQMPFLVRLHIVSAFVALALVPLTRIAIFAVAALQNCVVVVGYPARAAGNAVSAWLARHNPTAWFWPEED